jgi:uncharacterized protein
MNTSRESLERGIRLFNRGDFFEAHEVLEDVWRAAPPEQKRFLQGVVQLAVAFHHYSTGNRIGMKSVMERGVGNICRHRGDCCGIDLASLLRDLEQWRKVMPEATAVPPLPKIEMLR